MKAEDFPVHAAQTATKKPVQIKFIVAQDYTEIETLEGTMLANPGDRIIQGVSGEIYPCKPDIFEKTYTVDPNNQLDNG